MMATPASTMFLGFSRFYPPMIQRPQSNARTNDYNPDGDSSSRDSEDDTEDEEVAPHNKSVAINSMKSRVLFQPLPTSQPGKSVRQTNPARNVPEIAKNNRIGWFYQGELYDSKGYFDLKTPQVTTESVEGYAIVVTGQSTPQLLLASTYLQIVFRQVVDPLAGVSAGEIGITLEGPFAALFDSMDKMREYVQNDKSDLAQPEDFEALSAFYDYSIKASHDRIKASLNEGTIRFDDLWALFSPGELLYTKDEFDQPQLYRIGSSTYRKGIKDLGDDDSEKEVFKNMPFMNMFPVLDQPTRFCFDAWCIRWDGSTRTFSRAKETFRINTFRGPRLITSLHFYPLKYHTSAGQDDGLFRAEIESRGHRWRQYVSGTPICKTHNGPSFELEKGYKKTVRTDPTNLNDRVIIDNDGILHYEEPMRANVLHFPMMKDILDPAAELMNMLKVGQREFLVQSGDFDEQYNHFDDHPQSKEFESLQALLSPSAVNCFSLTHRKWFAITIGNLKEVEWSRSSFDHLVIDKNVKETIIKLVRQHRQQRDSGSGSDVIPGKGNGLVIVLHGPPGVGKTLTAESVAEYTKRPLYSINIGEVTSEQQVRGRLQQIFIEATRWNAVLLLDEADVVLEQRSLEDIRRNGTVSIFLRMLEYYEGILFLTTNRLKHIDDAFQSRIHLAFHYNDLTPKSRRTIWENFITRLPDEEGIGKEELTDKLDELELLVVNGRQIRNIMFIAQSLARSESKQEGNLRYFHVAEAIRETKSFLSYFRSEANDAKSAVGTVASAGRSWEGGR